MPQIPGLTSSKKRAERPNEVHRLTVSAVLYACVCVCMRVCVVKGMPLPLLLFALRFVGVQCPLGACALTLICLQGFINKYSYVYVCGCICAFGIIVD